MRYWLPKLVLLFSFLTLSAQAKNPCSCLPIPTSKTYIGEPRKKHTIGYSIDWTCTYSCKQDPKAEASKAELVKGTYHEYHMLEEDGREGICEGMVYKPQFVPNLNRYIYMYTGENTPFSPADSKAKELKSWAEQNFCD